MFCSFFYVDKSHESSAKDERNSEENDEAENNDNRSHHDIVRREVSPPPRPEEIHRPPLEVRVAEERPASTSTHDSPVHRHTQHQLSPSGEEARHRRHDERLDSPPLPPRTAAYTERVRSVSPRSFNHRDHIPPKRDILERHHQEDSRLSGRDVSPRAHHSPVGSLGRPVSPSAADSLRRDRPHSGSGSAPPKDTTTPPNVTVIQPSVNHPMFSYLYHPASMYSSGNPHSLPLSMGHMLFNSGVNPHGSLPFAVPSSLAAELGHLQGSAAIAAQAAAGLHPMLNGQLQALAGHHQALWAAAQNYPGASHGAFSHSSPEGSPSAGSSAGHLPGGHHIGPLFAPRATHRYSPYSLPLTKTTMATTSTPLVATGGGSSPVTSQSENSMTSPDHRSRVQSPTHSPSRGSPVSSHQSATATTTGQATSELKNIERMVNGLERQQEQLAVDSISKLEK